MIPMPTWQQMIASSTDDMGALFTFFRPIFTFIFPALIVAASIALVFLIFQKLSHK